MVERFWVGLAALCALAMVDCNPTVLQADFQPVGLSPSGKPAPAVAAPKDVLVFHDAAPDGFTLRENQLQVEAGYGHRILGTVEVLRTRGDCSVPDRKRFTAAIILEEAQLAAYRAGANALIFYVSDVPRKAEASQFRDICVSKAQSPARRWFSSGWAVVLAPSGPPAPQQPVESPAPEPVAPPADTAPPAEPPADAAPLVPPQP